MLTFIREIIDLISEFNSFIVAIQILRQDFEFQNALMINKRAQIVLNEFTDEKNNILIEDDENNLNDEKIFRAGKFLTKTQRFKAQKFSNISDMRYAF